MDVDRHGEGSRVETFPATTGPVRDPAPGWLETLFRQEYLRLVRTAALIVGDVGSAEEIVQEAFERLQRVPFHPEQPVGYVRAIVLNLCRSGLRRRGVARRRVERPAPAASGPEELWEVAEEHEEVLRLVQRLPTRQRAVVVCRYWLGMSELETAAALGISPGSVKSHSHRAVRAVERGLEAR